MKKIYFLAMLMGMFALVSCGSDDDGAANNGGNAINNGSSVDSPFGGKISASIEGVWYLKTEQWMHYVKGGEIYEREGSTSKVETHDDFYQDEILTISKSGTQYSMSYDTTYHNYSSTEGETIEHEVMPLRQVAEYDFMASREYDGHRIVIISASANLLTVGFYEDYDRIEEGKSKEYGLLTFMR